MGHRGQEGGFTLTEVLVTLGVVALFLGILFQTYNLNTSQKTATILRASASDIAQSNLRKVTKRTAIPSSGACDNTASGAGNENNLIRNPNAPGSIIARGTAEDPDPPGESNPWTNSLVPEKLDGTGLPAATVQSLAVQYPRGCADEMPAKVIATVTYGSESIVHAAYVLY